MHIAGSRVEYAHSGDRLRYFLAVCAHILYGRSSHCAGNAAHAFDAGAVLLHRMSNEIVPVFACARGKENFAILCRSIDPADRDLENESRPSGICDNKIASSAEDEDLERVLARVRQRFQDLILL